MSHLEDSLDLSRQSRRGVLSPWFDARLRRQMELGLFLPPSDLDWTGARLIDQLVDYRTQAGVFTAVLGMSGGVDSAVRRRC